MLSTGVCESSFKVDIFFSFFLSDVYNLQKPLHILIGLKTAVFSFFYVDKMCKK